MQNNIKIKYNGGAAMMTLVIFFVLISLTILMGIVTPTVREYRIVRDNLKSKQTYFLAESGIEDVVYRLKNSKEVGSTETLILGSSTATTSVTSLGANQKQISTLGDTSSLERKINVVLNTASGVSFNYGVQVGQGGVYLNSGKIYGNVYANGPISASTSGSNLISGTAISANSPASVTDQSNGTGTPGNNVIFGNASGTQDVAQGFQLATSSPLNKIQLYIKKVSNPGDLTVTIVNDNSGSPGSTVFASGTLVASSVTTSYGWIDVSFTTNSLLSIGTTYWLVLDGGTSSSKYYVIGANNNGYANGTGKIGQLGSTWNNTTPSGLDYFFGIYLGGINGSIKGDGQYNPLHIGTVAGTAQAHTVNYVSSTGNIYCKNDLLNNKACIDQADPTYTAFPISDANITDWQNGASAGGTIEGNYSISTEGKTIGPKVINGNFTVSSNVTVTITGNLWIKGNLILDTGKFQLAASYGSGDAVIVVDGTIQVTSGSKALGSGTAGSYLVLLAKSSSTSAINIAGDAGAMVVYAPNGTINVSGGSKLKEATGYKVSVTGDSSINYESGLTDMNFTSGPSGTWSVSSWKEAE